MFDGEAWNNATAIKTLSVGCHIEDGTGDSDPSVRVFSAALRF